jgi:RNA polymerase sigma factor (sigma-70 family)
MTVISKKITEFAYDPEKGKFKGWLKTMVNNRVRNHFRDRKDHTAKTADFARTQQREQAPDETFERMWMQEHLWHCLRELKHDVEPTTYRAFEEYVIKQRPLEDICSETDLSTNNIYTIKWRMTEKIAVKMKELLDGLE